MVKVYLEIEEAGKTVDLADDYRLTSALLNTLGGQAINQQAFKDKKGADDVYSGVGHTYAEAEFADSTDKLLIAIGDHGFYVLSHRRKAGTGAHILEITSDAAKSVYDKSASQAQGPVATPFNQNALGNFSLEDLDSAYMLRGRASHVSFSMNG